MPRSLLYFRIAIVFCFFTISTTFLKAQEPTIATCEGVQAYCLSEDVFSLCVEITLNPDFPSQIDHFEIDWGDGSPITSIPFSNNPTVDPHEYYFENLYNTCTYSTQYFVILTTFVVDGEPVANIIPVTFRNPPIASFSINPPVICVGGEACFNDASCPTEQLSIVSWNYGDGTNGSENCHVYDEVGTYTVELTVENPCGTATTTQTLTVIEPAQAEIAVIDYPNSDTINLCLGDFDEIELDGDSLSVDETVYEWQILNNCLGTTWTDPSNDNTPNVPDVSIDFNQEVICAILLEVDNACMQPSFDTVVFNVQSASFLTLDPQMDECLMLNYTPSPFNIEATYTINGTVIPHSDFPLALGVDEYIVTATLNNFCGQQIETDTFTVFSEAMVNVITVNDSVCVGSELILLEAEPPGGIWTGLYLVQIGDSTWFNPLETGSFNPTYTLGVGLCQDQSSVNIIVEGVTITAENYEVCPGSESFVLTANPNGGNWSSTDCPTCIQEDTFLTPVMINSGLTTVSVSYDVASAQGCNGMTIITVNLNDPQAFFTIDSTYCDSDFIQPNSNGTVADELIWRIDGVQVSPPPFSLAAGVYMIEQVAVIGDCRDSISFSTEVIATPTSIGFAVDPIEGCAELEVFLTNTSSLIDGLIYEWALDGEIFSNEQNPGSISLGQDILDTTTYTISLNIASGCGGGAISEEVSVLPQPTANFGTEFDEYCSGDTICFGNASFGGPTELFWIFHDGTTYEGFDPPCRIYFTDTVPSLYPVTMIATNACGVDTITREILVNPTNVNAFFNTSPAQACVGDSICFENFSTFGATIIYDFGDGNTTSDPDPCHIYETPGIYEVVLKAFGCGFDSTVTIVEILPLPEVTLDYNNTPCPGESITLEVQTNNVISYFWDFGDGATSTLAIPQHSFASPGSYNVVLTGISLNGCEQKDSVLINVLAPPTANFGILPDSLCTSDEVSFQNLSSADIITCFWDFGDGNTSNTCNPIHTYQNGGAYTVTLIVTNSNGCQDTFNEVVNVFAEPIPAFNVSFLNCTPVELFVNNESLNAQSYFWDFGNGETSTLANPSTIYDMGGLYTIQLTAINGLCSRSISLDTIIYQTPEITTSLSANTGCAPEEIQFGVTTNNVNNDVTWDFGDGAFAFDAITTHTYLDSGTYQVQLLITSPEGCADSTTEFITIYPPVLAEEITTDILCAGASTGAIDLSVFSGTAPFNFTWSNGVETEDQENIPAGSYQILITDDNGCSFNETYILTEPLPITASIIDNILVTCAGGNDGAICIEASGGVEEYEIVWEDLTQGQCLENVAADQYEVTITDANACSQVLMFPISENPPIEIFDSVQNISCFGADDGLILLDSINGGVSDFYNTVLEGPVNFSGGVNFSGLLPGIYQLTVQDLEGCLLEREYIIGEPDSLWLDILADSLFIGLGDSIEIETAHNADMPVFTWLPAIGLDCADCAEPFASPLETTTYFLDLLDQNACTANDTVVVAVDLNRKFYVPNTFTPNGDGRNDVFRIRTQLASVAQVNVFRVYDRWGELVFEATDFRPQEERLDTAWDGTFKGELLNPDNFIFYIEIEYVDGFEEVVQGTVSLIR